MRLMRFVSAACASGMLSFAFVGAASADSVGLSTTGPNSDNSVSISNTNTTDITNTNNVQIVNANEQQASSGGVSAKSNTAVMGGLGSGSATNTNHTNTSIAISNAAISPLPSTPGSGAGNQGQTPGSGAGAGAGSNQQSAGRGGAVLGASVTPGRGGGAAPAVLPATGALVPVDVSALRNAWHNAQAAVPTMPKSGALSTAMLAIAALLAVGGAALNTVYARRRERKVVL